MNVCVLGWYYPATLYSQLAAHARTGASVHIVAHQPGPAFGLPVLRHPNVGLEWGGYAHYLAIISASEPVLFMHDDLQIPDDFFARVARVSYDVAYLFASPEESQRNGRAHGRCLYLSARMVTAMRAIGGFWYDAGNHGETRGPRANEGIRHFVADLRWLRDRPGGASLRVGQAFVPEASFGYRGHVQMATAGRS